MMSVLDVCQCPDCTTHNECAKRSGEELYCVLQRSPVCIGTKRGCICPDCQIAQNLRLTSMYHCLNGPEIVRKQAH
jgi:hypothetical protein